MPTDSLSRDVSLIRMYLRKQFSRSTLANYHQERTATNTYSVAKPHLENRPIFFGVFSGNLCMSHSELKQISKNRDAGYLGYVLDFGGICAIEILDDVKHDGYSRDADCLAVDQNHGDQLEARAIKMK